MAKATVDTGSLISSSWEFFSKNFNKLWQVAVLLSLPSILSALFTQPKAITEEDLQGITDVSGFAETVFGVSLATVGLFVVVLLIVSAVYSAIVYGGSVSTLLHALKGGSSDISFSGVFNAGSQRIGQVILLGIAVGIPVVLGMILLIIPGLIVAFLLSLSLHFMIDKKLGIGESMSASYNTIKDNVGSVFMTYLMVFLITFGVSLVSGIIFGSDSGRVMQALAAVVAGFVSTYTLVVATKLYLVLTHHSTAGSASKAE